MEEIDEIEDIRLYDEAKKKDDGTRISFAEYLKKKIVKYGLHRNHRQSSYNKSYCSWSEEKFTTNQNKWFEAEADQYKFFCRLR